MPLSEFLYRMANRKVDSSAASSSSHITPPSSTDLSFLPENDFVELVWENGQIQPSRGRKTTTQSSQNLPKPRDRDHKDLLGNNNKLGKSGFFMDSVLSQIPVSVPSVPMPMSQHDDEDDVVPWLNYSLDDSSQQDYCSEFLSDLAGITVDDHSSDHNNLTSFDNKTGAHQSRKDSHLASSVNGLVVDHGTLPKVSSREGQASGHTNSSTQLYQLPSHQWQTSFPFFRTKIMGSHGDNNIHHDAASGTSAKLTTSGGSLPSIQAHKQLPIPTTSTATLVNFSHFLAPSAVNKMDFQNNASGISSTEIIESRDGGPIVNNGKYDESASIKSCIGLPKEASSNCHPTSVASRVDASAVELKDAEEPTASMPEIVIQEYDPKNYYQNSGEQVIKEPADGEKIIEPVVASSSVCSGNNMDRVSDDPTQKLKRKHPETEESEGPSEDIEEESVHAKKPTTRGGSGSKRSRAAEVHNLSERRRRDRINEKMRALQELIPNCNKVDKASMLDEAIEYLKTLQLQVQIMSMGARFYMPSMMLPHGMPHMHPPHIAQFPPVGTGIGMNMGFGMCMPDANSGVSGCSMMQVPPMHGAHFQGQPFSGPTSIHGIRSNMHMLGLSGQGLPMQFPHAPFVPISGSPNLKATLGPNGCGVVESATTSNARDSIHNVCSKLTTQANGTTSGLINQASSECQTMNDRSQKSALVQSEGNVSAATENNEMEKSANGNDRVPDREGCDGKEA